MKKVIIVLCLLTTGCETCREHPGACALATSVLVTSVALCAGKHKNQDDNGHDIVILPPNCAGGSCR